MTTIARTAQSEREPRSISRSPKLNLGGLEAMDALLHSYAGKAWLEVRGDER